jgi:transcriptional antiterminator
MIDINDSGNKITISKIADILNCSSRTIHRTMCDSLKREKEILNNQ